jgi:ParB/RepB/Spo0J family partition protein
VSKDKIAPPPPPGPRNNRSVVHGIIGQLNDRTQKRLADAYLLPIEAVEPNPAQPRRTQNAEQDRELAEDIQSNGILEPILVREAPGKGAGSYQIIAGERRYRAAKELGLAQVPVIIKDMDDRQVQLVSLAENLQRLDLSAEDEASYFTMLSVDFNYSTRDIAGMIHKSQSYVQARLNLLKEKPPECADVSSQSNDGEEPGIVSEKNNNRTKKVQLSENSQLKFDNYRPVTAFEKFLVKTAKRLPEMDIEERKKLTEQIKTLKDRLIELENNLNNSSSPITNITKSKK